MPKWGSSERARRITASKCDTNLPTYSSMNEIPHLDDAMWAFDDAGLPYPELPEDSASLLEMPNAEIGEVESMEITIPMA